MKSTTKDLLSRVAWQIPTGAVVAYGIVGNWYYAHMAQTLPDTESARHVAEAFKSAAETSKTVAELSLAYALVLDTVGRARTALERRRHAREDKIVEKAGILRPPPADIGLMVKPEYFKNNEDPQVAEHAAKIIQETKLFREVSRTDKDKIGISRAQRAFSTTRNIIILNPGRERDLVKASASRGTILDEESGKNVILLKPAAIRMAVAMGQYANESDARLVWDQVYHALHGKRLLREALIEAKDTDKPGAVVMDGSIALYERGGTVLPWNDYRYIGCEEIQGVETPEDAAWVALSIQKARVRDADRGRTIRLKDTEVKRLAKAIYEDAQKRQHGVNSNPPTKNKSGWLPGTISDMGRIDEAVDLAKERDVQNEDYEILTTQGLQERKKSRSRR